MKLRKIALVVGMGSLVACAMSRRDGGQSPAPAQVAPASPATGTSASAEVNARIAGYRAALTHGFTTDFTTSRIVGDANTPDYRVQAYLKSLEPRPEITCNDTQSFNVATGGPIHTTPATFSSWSSCAATDQLAFAIDSSASSGKGIAGTSVSPNDASAANSGIIVLTNLHTGGAPSLQSYAPTTLLPTSETFNLGGLIYNLSGTRLYALSNSGKLYCFNVPAYSGSSSPMTACTPGSGGAWPASGASTVTYSTPFPTYAVSGEIEHIYFGDDGDHINCIQGMAATTPGEACWTAPQLVSGGGSEVGPVVVNIDSTTSYETAYAGDSGGRFFRITNNGSAPTIGGTIEEADLYSIVSASYSATTWPVHGSPTIDFTSSNAYVTAAGYMFQFPLTKESNGGSWGGGVTTFKNLNLIQTASSTVDGSTSLDHTNGYAYVGYAGYLFKAAYPFDGNTSDKIYGTPLSQTVSGSPNYPIGYPLPYGPYSSIYIGTGTNSGTTGRMEAYTLNGTGAAPPLAGTTSTAYGDMIESGAVLDWASGNIYFGYDSGSGGIVQYPAGNPNPSSAWSCPSGDTLSGGACIAGCSGGPGAQGTCVNGSNVLSETCSASTNGVCSVATCAPNYADCDGLNANGCEVDYKTDPNNCGACAASGGTVCPTRNDVPACVNGSCSVTCDNGFGICSPGNINVSGCPTTISCSSCCNTGPSGSNTCAGGSTCDDGTCTTATEHVCASESSSTTPVTVTCPTGLTIQAVSFVSYGLPNGSCGSWSKSGTAGCDDSIPSTGNNTERAIATTACYGQTSCSITPDNTTFGTLTCSGTMRFAMQVECACPTILSLCGNGYQDGTETDVDCGGAAETGCTNTGHVPTTCAVGKMCEADSDCASGDCQCGDYSGNCSAGNVVGQCGAGKGVFATANTTGTAQTFTVPSGCSNVFVQAWGAGGGGGHSATGGSGGYVSSTFAVTAGQVIDAWIAGGGVCTKTDKTDAGVADPSGGGLGWQNATTTANGGGARNGGGNNCAGGGGGLTTIAYAPSSYAIYVAAGGGATNTASNTDWGGAGGGTTGGFSAGSKSGGCSTSGGDGTFAGESAPGGTTGGGGAGDKGGATETGCPGAGGASNSTGGVTITTVEANNADDGQPANNTVFDYLTSCGSPGVGGPATDTEPAAGGSGCVVIRCE